MTSSIFPLVRPFVLMIVQGPFDGLELPEFRRGICEARGLPGIRVHVQRKIAMNEVHLAGDHVIVDHLLHRAFKKSAARRALEIAEILPW